MGGGTADDGRAGRRAAAPPTKLGAAGAPAAALAQEQEDAAGARPAPAASSPEPGPAVGGSHSDLPQDGDAHNSRSAAGSQPLRRLITRPERSISDRPAPLYGPGGQQGKGPQQPSPGALREKEVAEGEGCAEAAAAGATFAAQAARARQRLPPSQQPPPPPLEPPAWTTIPERALEPERRGRRGLLFVLFVVLPTLLGAVFAYGIAADLYVSETRFFVRGQKIPSQPSLLGGLIGQVGLATAHEEAFSVRDFVHSHDAVLRLLERLDLRAYYRRPEADFVNRLEADASLERLVRYHRDMVQVRHDTTSGITTLRVFAWRAEDAKAIAQALLEQSEALVNRFSERASEDALRLARAEVAAAEARVAEVRTRLTDFRDRARELDPGQAGAAVLARVATLEGQLAQVRAEISEASAFMRPDNPRLVSLRARAAAIEEQIARERARLTGASGALAPVIAEYEQLQLAREFADRALASALTSLEQARIEAQRQQLYLVRVVEPQLAEEALYPRRWLIVLGTAAGSVLLYGIGVLVIAGIRDHIT